MGLFAIAGGAPPSGESVCCCSLYIVLPSVVLLSAISAKRESFWYAGLALALAGAPLALTLVGIAGYEPSEDWEVMDEQVMGRRVALLYTGTVAVAVLSLLYVAGRRLGWRPASGMIEPVPPSDDRITSA